MPNRDEAHCNGRELKAAEGGWCLLGKPSGNTAGVRCIASSLTLLLVISLAAGCAGTHSTSKPPPSASGVAGSPRSTAPTVGTEPPAWRLPSTEPALPAPMPSLPREPQPEPPASGRSVPPASGEGVGPGEGLAVLPSGRGAVGFDTRRFYPATPPGLLNSQTGQIYPRFGRGFVDPATGRYFPAPAGSSGLVR